MLCYLGRVKQNSTFKHAKKCPDSNHPAHVQSIIWAFALHPYILWYPMILLVDSKGPDQTVIFLFKSLCQVKNRIFLKYNIATISLWSTAERFIDDGHYSFVTGIFTQEIHTNLNSDIRK